MTFKSKVDTWLGAVLWCCVLLTAACGVFIILIGAPAYLLAVSLPLLIVLSGLCLWVRYATAYTLTATSLRSVSGPFRRTIALSELSGVTACRSWRPGLALSMDRVRLDYGKRSLLISPDNQAEFLAEIYRLRPELKPAP
ncbi:MAG: hypothetical protein BWY87_00330 [Deltaproteobacteria bacterium ADurb.Bin510]|nr:MAG: hypothetical protein BWY87_00330 [Deltaproteobacteria bacterium ADurb.Bin510]